MQPMQQPEPLSLLLFRVEGVEREITSIKAQLNQYEPSRENNLRLERINDAASRIADEIKTIKVRIDEINARVTGQEAAQDKLQIRVLVGILTVIITVVTSLLVFYITHGH